MFLQMPPPGNSEFIAGLIKDLVSSNPQEGQVMMVNSNVPNASSHCECAGYPWFDGSSIQVEVGRPLHTLVDLRSPIAAMPQLQGLLDHLQSVCDPCFNFVEQDPSVQLYGGPLFKCLPAFNALSSVYDSSTHQT